MEHFPHLDVLYSKSLSVGESPIWDEKLCRLYFVDILGKCFYSLDASGEAVCTELSQKPGALALCADGALLLAMEDGIYKYRKNEKLTLAHAPVFIKGERFNDGKVGPDGAYYVGTVGENFSGAFYRLHHGILSKMFDGCGCSNGLDFNNEQKKLYYCDSHKGKLESFDFGEDLSHRKTLFTIPSSLGVGDGMSIDENGNLWLAVWDGGCVLHIDAESGNVLQKIDLPVKKVSSCCFAGDDLRTLVITTASVRTDLTREPLAGQIFCIKTDVPGKTSYRYQE